MHDDCTPVQRACNSGVSGGLLPVQKSTSYNLDVCREGPTGRRRVKGGASSPAQDLRPVSEVEVGSLQSGNQNQVPGNQWEKR